MKKTFLILFKVLLIFNYTIGRILPENKLWDNHLGDKEFIPDGNNILKGKVSDAQSKQPLPGAVVSIPDLKIAVPTDENGNFEMDNLPSEGKYIIQIRYIGYKSINQTLDLAKKTDLHFFLETSAVEAGEVVVTGVSKATEVKKSPIPLVAINKTFIEQHAAAGNVIDLIANIPGVSTVTTGPNVSKPFIHGLGFNRVVTLMDGIRQEGQQWGDEHGIEVDQNSVDRIEIIKGPASLSYGSDAIGGVVNLISPSPVNEGKVLGSFSTLYGTNQNLLNESLRLQGNKNSIIWGTILSWKQAWDYQNNHDGRVYATNYIEKDARAMIGINKAWGYSYLNASLFDDLQSIPNGSRDSLTRKFTKQITDSDTFRPLVSQGELNSYAIPVLHQHVQLYRIYSNNNFIFGDGNLIANIGYQFSHRREYTHPQNPTVPGLNLELTTLTYDFKYNTDINEKYELSFGLNGMYQKNKLGYSTNFPIPPYSQLDIGPFIVVKRSFGKLDMAGGIRYDARLFSGNQTFIDTIVPYFPTLYSGSNPISSPNVIQQFPVLKKNFYGSSGSLGLTYNFSDKFLLKSNISKGFRAPSIAELSANGPDPGSQIFHVGNPNFLPEFSIQEDFGAFLTTKKISASVELFNNHIKNYIFQEEIDSLGQPERVNSNGSLNPMGSYSKFTYTQSTARIQGGEINVDYHPVHWLHFQNSISLTYGTNLGIGGKGVADSLKYLPFIPPLHTHSELKGSWASGWGLFKNLYLSFSLDHYNAQNRFFSAYGTETYTAGYNLINMSLGTNFTNKKGETILKIFIEGENLANISYQSNTSRLKYFDNPRVPSGVQSGIFNIGRNIDFKIVIPFDLNGKNPKVKGA